MTYTTTEIVFDADLSTKFVYSDDPSVATSPKPGLDVWLIGNSVVHHLGRTRTAKLGGAQVANIGGYTSTVKRDGVQIASKHTPNHLWNAIWRHDLSPLPKKIVRTPQQIFDLQLIQPYGIITPSQVPPDPKWPMPPPMSVGPVAAAQGATGERPDIGRINEGTGHWFQTGDPTSMLAYAEGLGAFSIYLTDDLTGAPFDMVANPKITVYPTQMSPGLVVPPSLLPGQGSWDVSHHPEQIAAFYATDDIYYLFIAQYWNAMNFLWTNFNYGLDEPFATLSIAQVRAFSHALRTLLDTFLATELYENTVGPVPPYLLSSSNLKKLIDNQRIFLTDYYVKNPAMGLYRYWGEGSSPSPWQMDHGHNILPLYRLHFPEWREVCLFFAKNLIDRTSGKTGWGAAYPSPYRFLPGPNFPLDQSYNPKTAKIADYFVKPDGSPDYAAAWTYNLNKSVQSSNYLNLSSAQASALLADPYNGGKWMQANTYDMYITRDALATMVWVDRLLDGAYSAVFPELEDTYAMQEAMAVIEDAKPGDQIPARQSVLVPVKGDPTIPPPPDQPPTGEPPMSDNALASLATAVHAITTVKDSAIAALTGLEQRLAAMVAAATGSGTQIDPAQLAALVTELQADKDALATAIANVPPAT